MTIICIPVFLFLAHRYEGIIKGLKTVDNSLRMHGEKDEGAGYLLGDNYSLAEAMTAPFVVRMLANFPEWRGVDLLEHCEVMGLDRLKKWFQAVSMRESTIQTTPAHESLVQLAPYVRKGFFEYKISPEQQRKMMGKIDFSDVDVEAEFSVRFFIGYILV